MQGIIHHFEQPRKRRSIHLTFDLAVIEKYGWLSSDSKHFYSTEELATFLLKYYFEKTVMGTKGSTSF
jgi:hypothetical protein